MELNHYKYYSSNAANTLPITYNRRQFFVPIKAMKENSLSVDSTLWEVDQLRNSGNGEFAFKSQFV